MTGSTIGCLNHISLIVWSQVDAQKCLEEMFPTRDVSALRRCDAVVFCCTEVIQLGDKNIQCLLMFCQLSGNQCNFTQTMITKVSFYTVLYPVLKNTQSTSHITAGRPVYSNTM